MPPKPKRRGSPARGAGDKKRRTRLEENLTQEDQRMEQSQDVPNDCYQMCVPFHLISMMTFCYTLLGLFTR